MDIAIIGSGYVGLVTGACLADVRHNVVCVDNDQRKVERLQRGVIPIYEPGLEEVVHRNVSANRLRFTTSTADGVANSQIIFIAVPTPPQPDGSVDLAYIEKVAREIAEVLKDYRVIVDKSTVPVKTGEKVAETIRRYTKSAVEFDVVSNPEFLREGCAVSDLMSPDRIVIGSNSDRALALMKKVYEPEAGQGQSASPRAPAAAYPGCSAPRSRIRRRHECAHPCELAAPSKSAPRYRDR